MYRNLIRWSLVHQPRVAALLQGVETRPTACRAQWTRQLAVTHACWKKRRSEEEKVTESHGRRVIRYSRKAGSQVVGIWKDITVQDLAQLLGKDVEHVLRALSFADKTDFNYRPSSEIRDQHVVRDVVKICGARCKVVAPPHAHKPEDENKDAVPGPPAPPEALKPRPPVVCIMGHVDHGKTTLLDALRHSSLVDKEFGGITQHIGAFEVQLPTGDRVTFLDTPGHAAFSAMRARGAMATDIVVLVVAADDGVMDQTREAIRMANDAKVPILVAINKIDKPGVNIDKTIRALAAHGVVCEAAGGDVQAVPISALKKQGLEALVEALTLQAQLMDLKADYEGNVEGTVIEAQIHPHLGKQATVLVSRGTLRPGALVVAGLGWARVRALTTADGRPCDQLVPSTAAAVAGWRALPTPGDTLLQVPSEKRANELIRWREAQRMKEKQMADMEAIEAKEATHRASYTAALARKRALGRYRTRREGPRAPDTAAPRDTHNTLSVTIKGDVEGSVEAILDILMTYDDHQRLKLDVVHAAVGAVTSNDIELAEAFDALVFAFNVECLPGVEEEAAARGVAVRPHTVVYRLVQELKDDISARLPPTPVEEIAGEATVLQAFMVSEGKKKVPVAGARVTKGTLHRDQLYRVLRNGQVLCEGKLASMKHLKEEVSSVSRGTECGLRLDVDWEPQPGDTLVSYRIVQQPTTTQWDPGF